LAEGGRAMRAHGFFFTGTARKFFLAMGNAPSGRTTIRTSLTIQRERKKGPDRANQGGGARPGPMDDALHRPRCKTPQLELRLPVPRRLCATAHTGPSIVAAASLSAPDVRIRHVQQFPRPAKPAQDWRPMCGKPQTPPLQRRMIRRACSLKNGPVGSRASRAQRLHRPVRFDTFISPSHRKDTCSRQRVSGNRLLAASPARIVCICRQLRRGRTRLSDVLSPATRTPCPLSERRFHR
jgi:hypothetical protein